MVAAVFLHAEMPAPTLTRVKLSVRSDYAARAVLGLARRAHLGKPVTVEDLANSQHIPANFLVQILLELKAANIVKSVRGKAGGYLLARSPAEITLGDLLRCVNTEIFDTPALSDPSCPPELQRAWLRLRTSAEAAAAAINFQQLLEETAEKEKMYYI